MKEKIKPAACGLALLFITTPKLGSGRLNDAGGYVGNALLNKFLGLEAV